MGLDLQAIAPELVLAFTLALTLVLDLLFRREERRLTAWLAAAGLALAAHAAWRSRGAVQPVVFSGMITADAMGAFFKILFCGASALVILLSYRSREIAAARHGELHVLLLAATLGMCLMASARDLVMLYLAVEILSQASYVLAGYIRRDARSHEAALKYVIYGGVASGAMIFGISLLYGLTGATDLELVGRSLAARSVSPAAYLAFVLVLVGLGFKVAMVPFHMWTPDVYEGSPTPVTAFLSVGSKAAGFSILLRFLLSAGAVGVDGGWREVEGLDWRFLVGVLAVLTMTIGNLAAIGQRSLKRLLAYSSIAHAGYLLTACALATSDGVSSVLFYLVVYAVMNLGAFGVVIAVVSHTGRDDERDYAGLGWTHPFLATALSIFLVSLVGLPPTAGFLGKWYLLAALVRPESAPFLLLALAALVNTVISLYYYVYVIKRMWLEQPQAGYVRIRPGFLATAAIAALAALTLYPFGYGETVLTGARDAVRVLVTRADRTQR